MQHSDGGEEGRRLGQKEGVAIGKKQGITIGIRQKAIETARNMLNDGVASDLIMKHTGISTQKLESL